jgi:transposase
MAARNSNSCLKTFYENIVARGKKKMVALVALMRKILVIANASLKEALNSPEFKVLRHS